MLSTVSKAAKPAQREALMTKVEGLKMADAAIFGHIIQHVGPLSQWPIHTLDDMLGTHLVCQSRTKLSFFLLGNECPPDMMAQWMKQRNMLHDFSACRHIADMIKKFSTGELAKFTTYMLPFRVTCKDKMMTKQMGKAMFAAGHKLVPSHLGGNPIPRDAASSAFVFPIESPDMRVFHTAIETPDGWERDTWRWELAYKILGVKAPNGDLTRSASAENLIKITPLKNPDDLDAEDDVQTDMYGTPADAYLAECMDLQFVLHCQSTDKKRTKLSPPAVVRQPGEALP